MDSSLKFKESFNMKKILVVDDEIHILELVKYNLVQAGYEVITAESGEDAVEYLKKEEMQLVLLDWMLPKMDGIEVLQWIRLNPNTKKLPVILLTAKSDEISKVVGLEVGADDYLAKPFGIHELMARIKALLRRADYSTQVMEPVKSEDEIRIDEIVINKTRRTVVVRGVEIELSMKEFDLLYLLASNRGIVFSRVNLLESVWGYDYIGETRTVDVHISNLRKKIEEDDAHPVYIKTVRGVGYKFQ